MCVFQLKFLLLYNIWGGKKVKIVLQQKRDIFRITGNFEEGFNNELNLQSTKCYIGAYYVLVFVIKLLFIFFLFIFKVALSNFLINNSFHVQIK